MEESELRVKRLGLGGNFHFWTKRMEVHFESLGLKEYVFDNDVPVLTDAEKKLTIIEKLKA